MQYPWQAHYFPGIPTTSTIPEPQTVVALLEHSFVTYRDSDAYVFMGHTLRYGDVDALSQALAAWLQAQPLQQGDCVAIMLPNLLGCPVAMAAVLRAGLVAVYINPLHTPRGLQHQFGRFRYRHEITPNFWVGDRNGAAAANLVLELRHHAAGRAQHIAEPHDHRRNLRAPRPCLQQHLGQPLRRAHHVSGIDGLIGRDKHQLVDRMTGTGLRKALGA